MDEQTHLNINKNFTDEEITVRLDAEEKDIVIVSPRTQRKQGMLAFRLARGDKKNIAMIKKYYRTNSASQAIRLCLEDKVKGIKNASTIT